MRSLVRMIRIVFAREMSRGVCLRGGKAGW